MFMFFLLLPSFSSAKKGRIEILMGTMVKEVKPNSVFLQRPGGTLNEVPCGMIVIVWAAGNKGRAVTVNLMGQRATWGQMNRQGIMVDEYLKMVGTANKKISDATKSSTEKKPAETSFPLWHQLRHRRLHCHVVCADRTGRVTAGGVSGEVVEGDCKERGLGGQK
ncbi:hypothetical protein C8J56DRAFT_1119794 [Mycena floridula]|nr:hypothetical protein C8J56DRAFT_1119794 [Mycena floridula]